MGQPPAPMDRPTAYAPHEGAPAHRRRPWGAVALGLVIGLVVAAVVGAALIATKIVTVGSGDADRSGVSADPITLPATLAGFQTFDAANQARAGSSTQAAKAIASQKVSQRKIAAATIAAYQLADPGAAVAYQAYARADLLSIASVIAVRAMHPGLTFGPISDPADLGLAVSPKQIKMFGDVQCLVYQSQPTTAGSPVNAALDVTNLCQRTGPLLSIQVYGGEFDGTAGQQEMVALTNAAWTSITG